jgi:hypothetical protein
MPSASTPNFLNSMAAYQGPIATPSSELNSSKKRKLVPTVPDKQSGGEGESSGTEQSFRTAHADAPPKPRISRFIERFESIKLTERNLAMMQADCKRVPPQPTSPIDSHFRLEPSPGATTFRIKRKPLPDSARNALQEMKDDAQVAALEKRATLGLGQNRVPLEPTRDRRSSFHRTDTVFTDFLPYGQLRTWQQVDNEDYQDRRRHSLSAIALNSMKKLNLDRDTLSAQSAKTANQLRKVMKRHVLDKEKSTQ